MTTSVMFFCLGNICRSPLAEGIFRAHLKARGLEHEFSVSSSGTSAHHIGEAPDLGSQRVAKRLGEIDISDQRAQQLTAADLESFDYLIAMSRSNLHAARQLKGGERAPLLLMRDFEPKPQHRGQDVPDPWGHGDEAFEEVYRILDRSMGELIDYMLSEREEV